MDSIFDRARQFGAREGIVEAPPAPSIRGAFSGMGRTISGEPRAQEPGQASGPPPPPPPVFHTITFWRNGFTVDDGPLRRLDDPANAPFLAVRFKETFFAQLWVASGLRLEFEADWIYLRLDGCVCILAW